MKYFIMILSVSWFIGACSSLPKRVVLDSSGDKPSWTDSSKLVWEEDGFVVLKASQVVRGNERPNGCLDLAKLDAKENLISEIKNDVKGSLDNAQQSISEDAEILLGKARSSEFEGSISGLRFEESFWEKYQVGEAEQKVQCHVLGKMKKENYLATKRAVVNKVAAVDPRLKEAITKKQIDFFSNSKPVDVPQRDLSSEGQ
jgi:hypothetical protein